MIFIPNRNYRELYRPKIDINFTRAFVDDDAEAAPGQPRARVPAAEGKYHLYHSDGGENQIRWLTRINVVFIVGNGALLALELLNPCKWQASYFLNPFLPIFSLWLLARSIGGPYRYRIAGGVEVLAPLLEQAGE